MKKVLTLILCLAIASSVPAQFGKKLKNAVNKAEKTLKGGAGELTKEEAGNGLKEALNIGVGKAVDFLSAEDGYLKSIYKIPIPDEAQTVFKKIKAVPGFGDAEEKMTVRSRSFATHFPPSPM